MKMKPGIPCPVAALARSGKCLEARCGWYIQDSDPHCLMALHHMTIMKLCDEVEHIKEIVEGMGPGLDSITTTLEEIKAEAQK